MTRATPTAATESSATTTASFTAFRLVGFVVLLLMAVSIVYAGWIVLDNWGYIGV